MTLYFLRESTEKAEFLQILTTGLVTESCQIPVFFAIPLEKYAYREYDLIPKELVYEPYLKGHKLKPHCFFAVVL